MSEVANKNPKGYNNQKDWEKFEKSPVYTKVDFESEEEEKYTSFIDEPEDFNDENNFDVEEVDLDSECEEQTFDEVLTLTTLDSGISNYGGEFAVAKYDKINILDLTKRAQAESKIFVQKIAKFIIDFGDVELSAAHKRYINEVAKIEWDNLADLQRIALINNEMINNITERVNASTAEDYAVIASYNNLINIQLRVRKEIMTSYTQIPNRIKKMKADIVCNQELNSYNGDNDGPITEDSGVTHFNSQKQLLATLSKKIKAKTEGMTIDSDLSKPDNDSSKKE